MKKFKISFYCKENGARPVIKYIKDKNKEDKGKINRKFKLLEIIGHLLSMPHARRLTSKIIELRPEGMRLFYYLKDNEAVFVHAVDKKDFTQTDILTAENRRIELEGK